MKRCVGLMAYTREDLELVEKHVAQGERNVWQQRQIVSGLSEGGYATGEALDLLAALESTLQQLQQRRSLIRRAMLFQDATRIARASLRPVQTADPRPTQYGQDPTPRTPRRI